MMIFQRISGKYSLKIIKRVHTFLIHSFLLVRISRNPIFIGFAISHLIDFTKVSIFVITTCKLDWQKKLRFYRFAASCGGLRITYACRKSLFGKGIPPTSQNLAGNKRGVQLHWSDLANQFGSAPGVLDAGKRQLDVDEAFQKFGDGVLTPREKEVVEFTLKGHSADAVGRILEISPGTVRIHRRNIYAKLRIRSQGELFSRFIQTVLRPME